jgi:uncharacterized membrane protein HdeD (DUF308 family)
MAERISPAAMQAGLDDTRNQMRDAFAKAQAQIAEHWIGYLVLGCVLVLAGMAAIAFPYLSTVAAKIALGWIFVFSGAAIIFHAFSAGDWRGFFWNLLIGLLHLGVGGYLALLPLTGILTLTVLIAALLIADGILEVGMALHIRPHDGWGWVLVSGLVAIAAGVLIALQLPNSATWTIGLLIGIKMLFAGWSFITLALGAHRAVAPTSPRAA